MVTNITEELDWIADPAIRCNRNCYNCPECTSNLTVSALDPPDETSAFEGPNGPFILSCSYCQWTSLDIGIKLEKPNNITGQLQRIRNGGIVVPTPKERETQAEKVLRSSSRDDLGIDSAMDRAATPVQDITQSEDDLFSNLNSFYKSQLADSSEFPGGAMHDINYSSPSSISRLLHLYGPGKKSKRTKPKAMREALTLEEGLQVFDPASEDEVLKRLQEEGWDATTATSQRAFQERHSPRFTTDLRPVATLLRTKRSKRCKTCRTLLARPEPKVTSNRYKLRVLALNNIPKVSIRSLTASAPITATTHPLVSTSSLAAPNTKLQPGNTYQYLLTLMNPLFDPIRVTLATPAVTQGRIQTRVTILCPNFEVGANTDVWDEALNSSATQKRKSLMPGASVDLSDGAKPVEAGKIWDKGRNWTSVVVEVVPGILPIDEKAGKKVQDDLEPDEDACEIPIFVRLEYDAEATGDGGERSTALKTGEGKEKREVAFWSVLGVGRITEY
ncbi:putative dynactin arp1 p62 subunit ro2 [Venturia nashicola]|uniref:Dynactin subunit 4 n=1 Tax=Venturia nashicola TaxID=86259 RepID=A0A4Z1PP96_9PEZI|nr:putative dynactin arp1 p62 subunit ro2 [Venturia nashicola]TLD36755.1 putative dynactin arp1 p62 subunit ro2 [Venturia nashicola]